MTKPARTIVDLRRVVPAEVLRRAVRQAEVLGLEIGTDIEPEPTRSELERRFLRLCGRHRLDPPEVNVSVGPFVVDFLWREQRLIVETDGYRFHRGRQAFEDDHAREVELQLLGYDVVRFTYRRIAEDPAGVVETLRSLLGAGKVRRSSR